MCVVYIYGLHCPVAGTIRYVGKSTNPKARLKSHIGKAVRGTNNHHTAAWLRKIISLGHEPVLIILQEISDGVGWQKIERKWIANGNKLGWNLTNSTAGGEGLDYLDQEAKQRYLDKLSKTMKEIWNDPSRAEENRLRAVNSWADPNLAEARRAAFSSDEHRKKMSAATKKAWSDPAKKSKFIATITSPEYRAKRSDIARRTNANISPGEKARLAIAAAARWEDPQFRETMAEKFRSAWSDPEKRARRCESIRNGLRLKKMKDLSCDSLIER